MEDQRSFHLSRWAEQLAMDARGAPYRVGLRHLADKVARAEINGRPPGGSARAPGPETPEGAAVPAHDGIRADDREGAAPTHPRARQRDPEEPIGSGQGRPGTSAPEDGELLAKGEILDGQVGAGAQSRPGGGDEGDKEREHPPILYLSGVMGTPPKYQDHAQIEFGEGQDLERLRQSLGRNAIADFTLGADDAPEQLRVPSRLYGREPEVGRIRPRSIA